MSVYKLENVIQNYAWGSKESIANLFGIDNPEHLPQAEIWMGAHPNGCSRITNTGELLSNLIERDSKNVLGEYTAMRFGELPYLFKVLAAETPLSIQVHPSKHQAEAGFTRENEQGIPLSAAHRNYKDPNHKPELVYALTFYKAMNGFRPIEQIIELFHQASLDSLNTELAALEAQPNSEGLREFFTAIMSLCEQKKADALHQLDHALERGAKTALMREVYEYVTEFKKHYPGDIGLLSPLLLNTVELAPGEAMFLHAETPHAYVKGTGLEIMANSDNVLRAGLTPKHIDVPELIANTRFVSTPPEQIRLLPIRKQDKLSYPIPVDDFGFDMLTASRVNNVEYMRSAEVLLCVDGEVTLEVKQQKLLLKAGESVFISHDSGRYSYQGQGTLARAYN